MTFVNCALFAILQKEGKGILIRRISGDEDTQSTINDLFSSVSEKYITDFSPIDFDGKYTPQDDDKEYLVIRKFILPEEIKRAIRNPLGVEIYKETEGILPGIKALFLGNYIVNNGSEVFDIAFQKFRHDQYITQRRFNLLLSGDTFVREKRNGISIGETIDALYTNTDLAFRSYYYARQIFNLSDYYRIASNKDIETFTSSELIHCDNIREYMSKVDTWERKKIASILDSGLLGKYNVKQIQKKANDVGLSIKVTKNQIVFPLDKRQRKILLGFLDEEVYRGVFTNSVYQTNSKKKA